MEGRDYLTINIHNPLWFIAGAITGGFLVYGVIKYWIYVIRTTGG
jgi:hypothetical protein